MTKLSALRTETANNISAHWKSCEEGGLPHTPANCGAVQAAFETFFDAMGRPGVKPTVPAALNAIRELYAVLAKINAEADGGLLETDERELLVPVVMAAVEACGIDLEQFPDGEPGGEFRTF